MTVVFLSRNKGRLIEIPFVDKPFNWLLKLWRRWQSIRSLKAARELERITKLQVEAIPSYKLYCHNSLMLDVFIDILVTNNLQLLVKEGTAPEELLVDKWNDIHLNYCDMIGNNKYTLGVRLAKEMAILESKSTLVASCGQLLMNGFHEEVAAALKSYGLSVIYIEDETKYLEQFKRLESKLKAWKLDYDIKEKEYQKLTGNSIKTDKADRSHFDSLLIDLSAFLGYPVKENETSVAKFGLMINKMHKHYENLTTKKNGTGKV